jgi:hypothetical protein
VLYRKLEHANGRLQSEQAVQATNLESVRAVDDIGVQLVQGIDPF